jgi:hypothetical protein
VGESRKEADVKFARWIFAIAGVYGLISVGPLYFMEKTISQQDPPPLTHPMFFYGFVGATLAWQLLFFAIAKQPVRLHAVMPFAALEKLSFGAGAMVLRTQGRLDHPDVWFGGIDLLLAVLFVVSWFRVLQSRQS